MLTDTQYEGAVGEVIEQGDDGVNPIRVLVYCVPPILAFIGRKVISKDNDPIINLSVNMSVVTAALYLIAMTTSGVLIGRLPIYTSLFDFILLPYITSKLFSGKTAQIINILMVWTLTGIWHGANLNFLFWGLYYGIILFMSILSSCLGITQKKETTISSSFFQLILIIFFCFSSIYFK
jgi:hypothetical protein